MNLNRKTARSEYHSPGNSLFEYAAWLSLLVPVVAIALMLAVYFHVVLTIRKHRRRSTVIIAGLGMAASGADTLVSIVFFLMGFAVT